MWKIEKIVKKGDYRYAVVKEHPRASKHGYVLHHRVVMENFLGRLLNPNEIVHHKDENKLNDHPSNLEVLTAGAHASEHGKSKGRKWCVLKCPECKTLFERERRATFLSKPKYKYTTCSGVCRGKFSSRVQYQGITPEVEIAISENLVSEYQKYSDDNPEETATTGSVETIRDQPEMAKI